MAVTAIFEEKCDFLGYDTKVCLTGIPLKIYGSICQFDHLGLIYHLFYLKRTSSVLLASAWRWKNLS